MNAMDCGPTCLRMIVHYYGLNYSLEYLRQATGYTKSGVSLLGISEAAERIGFRAKGITISFEELIKDANLPCILHWNRYHFVVLLPMSRWNLKNLKVADPAKGVITYSQSEFKRQWLSSKNEEGIAVGVALLLEPTPGIKELAYKK